METRYSQLVFVGFFLLLLYLSFRILQPLADILLWSLVLAYLFYPVYRFINARLEVDWLSSIITVLIMVLVVTVPFVFLVKGVSQEVLTVYGEMRGHLQSGDLTVEQISAQCAQDTGLLCRFIKATEEGAEALFLNEPARQAISAGLGKVTNAVGSFVFRIPVVVFKIALAIFITFFLLKDGKTFAHKLFYYLPMKREDVKAILSQLNTITYSIVFATLLVAFLQGLMAMLGFWIIGLENPILLGAFVGFAALLPVVGTGLVWVPISLYLIAKGLLVGATGTVWMGVAVLGYGGLVIATMDNFLRPWIAGDKAHIHPVVIIIGVLGGIALFNFIGLFIGPIVLALLITFIKLSKEKFHMGAKNG